MIKFKDTLNIYSWIIVLMTFVGGLAWQLNTAMYLDDYVYALATPIGENYNDNLFWGGAGEEYTSVEQLFEVIKGHIMNSNSRFSNILYILLQFLPLWIVKTLCGLSVGFMFCGIMFYSLGRKSVEKPALFIIGAFLFWFLFPWADNMRSSVFIFNYGFSSCFWLVWLCIYNKIDNLTKSYLLIFVFLTAFLSLYHEGFTIAFGTYIFFDTLINHKKSRIRYVLWGIMVVSVIWMFFSGSGSRLDKTFSLDPSLSIQYRGIQILFDLSGVLISTVILILIYLFGKKVPRDLLKKQFMPYVFAMVPIVFCLFFVWNSSRTLWPANLFAVFIILKIADLYIKPKKYSVFLQISLIIFLAIYGFWLWQLVRWERVMATENNRLIEIIEPRKNYQGQIVFMDKTPYPSVPIYLLDIPSPYYENIAPKNFVHYWLGPDKDKLVILPPGLKDMTFDSLPMYPGTARARGLWPNLIFEKPINGNIRVVCAGFEDGSNFFYPLLAQFRKIITGHHSDAFYPKVETEKMLWPDSTVIYGDRPLERPRTFQWRKVIAIDTIETN